MTIGFGAPLPACHAPEPFAEHFLCPSRFRPETPMDIPRIE